MELSRAAGILFIVLPGVQWVGGSEPSFLGEPIMPILVEAIYEGGVLRPVEPLPLKEHEKVRITIHPDSEDQPAPDATRRGYGLIRWTGSLEDLDYLIEDAENDPLEGS
jgi:predicted DNA-binding antitoxin AbrB/MazE fold protein